MRNHGNGDKSEWTKGRKGRKDRKVVVPNPHHEENLPHQAASSSSSSGVDVSTQSNLIPPPRSQSFKFSEAAKAAAAERAEAGLREKTKPIKALEELEQSERQKLAVALGGEEARVRQEFEEYRPRFDQARKHIEERDALRAAERLARVNLFVEEAQLLGEKVEDALEKAGAPLVKEKTRKPLHAAAKQLGEIKQNTLARKYFGLWSGAGYVVVEAESKKEELKKEEKASAPTAPTWTDYFSSLNPFRK